MLSVDVARELARTVLRGVPERWRHTTAVVAQAAALADTVPASDRVLFDNPACIRSTALATCVRKAGTSGCAVLSRTTRVPVSSPPCGEFAGCWKSSTARIPPLPTRSLTQIRQWDSTAAQ